MTRRPLLWGFRPLFVTVRRRQPRLIPALADAIGESVLPLPRDRLICVLVPPGATWVSIPLTSEIEQAIERGDLELQGTGHEQYLAPPPAPAPPVSGSRNFTAERKAERHRRKIARAQALDARVEDCRKNHGNCTYEEAYKALSPKGWRALKKAHQRARKVLGISTGKPAGG